MKQRCLNKNNVAYNRYGEIGITVCGRWLEFSNFLEDMGERPEGTSLDRIDGTKGYYKENCRWSTSKEQILNSKSYKNGKRLCYEPRPDSKKHWKATRVVADIRKSKLFHNEQEARLWLDSFSG